ncbi:MAG: purine-nucleoside phosphorylase [Dongiaceae bacterium]
MATPHDAAAAIRARAPDFAPRIALVLGSGLGAAIDGIVDHGVIDYRDIPGFPRPSVEGHAGTLRLGLLGGAPVACLQGRVHSYEGAPGAAVRLYVRALKLIGCEILLLTNAAGSLRREVGAGNLMMITDHINMQPFNPLVGPNDDEFGPRFPAMDGAYDIGLRKLLLTAAQASSVALHEGVYLACMGPNFETPAEVRAYQRLGADAVGMSTVPEVIVARHCGLKVAAISAITNLAVGLGDSPLSHAQTLAEAGKAAEQLRRLLNEFLRRFGDA